MFNILIFTKVNYAVLVPHRDFITLHFTLFPTNLFHPRGYGCDESRHLFNCTECPMICVCSDKVWYVNIQETAYLSQLWVIVFHADTRYNYE